MTGISPLISIITPSYNRADELKYLYKSLKNQTIDKRVFEFIVSDDGSTDNTEEIVKKWQLKSEFKIKFIKQNNQGPGSARNHGLQNAQGEIILFIDSDCEAHPDWIKTIHNAFQDDRIDAFGGPDAAKEDFEPLQKAIDFSMTSFFTTGGMRGHSDKMMAKFFPRTHNMGIQKHIYNKIGGFGELRHGQDIEFSNRMRKTGANIKFLIEAIVYHRRRSTLKQFFKQVFNWGVARINLGKIDKEMLEFIHFLPSIAIIIFSIISIVVLSTGIPIIYFILATLIPLICLAMFGTIKKKDIRIFHLLIIVIPAQIFGYGLGFIFNFINRYIFNRDSWTGFIKKYYD